MQIPRITITGISSGIGKTTFTIGLLKALENKGLNVQPFKVGPDFIDVSYHNAACKNFSRNLDFWILGKKKTIQTFLLNSKGKDICVIEGVMGLFDGSSYRIDKNSTFEIAKILQTPIILIIDVFSMSGSAAAIVLGVKEIVKPLKIYAILNKVASKKHYEWVKKAIEKYSNVKVLGSIEFSKEIQLEERHLGLIPYYEIKISNKIEKISKIILESVDVESIIEIAKKAPPINNISLKIKRPYNKVKIAVAFDEAINFYYRDSIETLERFGANIHYFSLIKDEEIPDDIGGIYIGGGYPEVYAKKLEKNFSIRNKIKKLSEDGCPIYAECGGFMYLTKSIFDGNKKWNMVGIFDGETRMTNKLTLSYTKAEVLQDNPISYKGAVIKGHEFHYSIVENINKPKFVYKMKIGKGIIDQFDGWLEYNSLGTYSHINFASNYKIAKRFINSALKFLKR